MNYGEAIVALRPFERLAEATKSLKSILEVAYVAEGLANKYKAETEEAQKAKEAVQSELLKLQAQLETEKHRVEKTIQEYQAQENSVRKATKLAMDETAKQLAEVKSRAEAEAKRHTADVEATRANVESSIASLKLVHENEMKSLHEQTKEYVAKLERAKADYEAFVRNLRG